MSELFPFRNYARSPSPDAIPAYLDLVRRRISADSVVQVVTSAYTVPPEVQWVFADATAGAFAVTIPSAETYPFRKIGVVKTDSSSNAVTVTRSGSDTLSGATTISLATQWQTCTLVSNGIATWANEHRIAGPITVTDLTVSTIDLTGGQITFPATQAASSDANTLDDYEEGTFTPTLAGSTTAGTQTYDTQSGRYIKIGKQVHVQIVIILTAKDGTTAGNMRVAGLPFTTISSAARASMAIAQQTNWDLNVAGGYYSMSATAATNSTVIALTEIGDNVAAANLVAADFADTSEVWCGATYEAAA